MEQRFQEIREQQQTNQQTREFLEQRAALETTNVEWQNQAGQFIDERLGDYALALTYQQRVLRQSLLQYGEESDWTATSYYAIGITYHKKGDYAKALEYYQKALDILEKALGTEHPITKTVKESVDYARQKMSEE